MKLFLVLKHCINSTWRPLAGASAGQASLSFNSRSAAAETPTWACSKPALPTNSRPPAARHGHSRQLFPEVWGSLPQTDARTDLPWFKSTLTKLICESSPIWLTFRMTKKILKSIILNIKYCYEFRKLKGA